MADKGSASVAASVFMDDIKGSMGGTLEYTPVSGDDDAWIFAEIGVTHNGTNILDISTTA